MRMQTICKHKANADLLMLFAIINIYNNNNNNLPLILSNHSAALTARVSRSTISCTNARLTHALLAGTDRIHSNSYTNTHTPTLRPLVDKQCRSAIIISTTVTCRLKEPK